MATKTFKLGEVCKGGVITAVTKKTKVTIIAKEWDFKSGSKKGNSQANAKEWNRLEVDVNDTDAYRKIYNFLVDLTTHYHSDNIVEWCRQNSEIKKGSIFL